MKTIQATKQLKHEQHIYAIHDSDSPRIKWERYNDDDWFIKVNDTYDTLTSLDEDWIIVAYESLKKLKGNKLLKVKMYE